MDIKYNLGKSDLIIQRLTDMQKANQEAKEVQENLMFNKPSSIPISLADLKINSAYVHKKLFDEALTEVGNLSAVDGAVVIDEDFTIYGFGAKLQLNASANNTIARKDVLNIVPTQRAKFSDLGGTRHQSAARFVQNHNGVWAFVVSQDGRVTLFTWVTNDKRVLAIYNLQHLMWD